MFLSTRALVSLTTLPSVFEIVGEGWLGVSPSLSGTIRSTLSIVILWPFAIGWRRYFQGLLIHDGQSNAVAQAGIIRLLVVGGILAGGFTLRANGAVVAGMSLVWGVIAEAIAVTYLARKLGTTKLPKIVSSPELPQDLAEVWKFYAPLGGTMMLGWGRELRWWGLWRDRMMVVLLWLLGLLRGGWSW